MGITRLRCLLSTQECFQVNSETTQLEGRRGAPSPGRRESEQTPPQGASGAQRKMPFPLGPRRRNLQTAPATSSAARSRCLAASPSPCRALKGIPGLSRLPTTVGGQRESPGTACRPPVPAPPHCRQPPHLSDSVCASRAPLPRRSALRRCGRRSA